MIPRAVIREGLDTVAPFLSALSERQFVSLKLGVVFLSLAVGSIALMGSANELYAALFDARYRLALLLGDEEVLRGDLKKIERELIDLKGQGALIAKSGAAEGEDIISVIDEASRVSGARIGGLNVVGGVANSKKKRHQLAISGGYKEIAKFAELLSERSERCRITISEIGIKSLSFRYPKEPLEGRVLIDEEISEAP
jgi:hypothetical protein